MPKERIFMKKVLTALLSLVFALPLLAEEYPIRAEQLPAKSQKIIAQCWPDATVEKAVVEKRASLVQFNVELSGGVKMQFSKSGSCTECICKKKTVPDVLVPSKIRSFMKRHFPERQIREIEHDSKLYTIILDNKWELTFDSVFRLIDFDKP